jgi:hypothetical protein
MAVDKFIFFFKYLRNKRLTVIIKKKIKLAENRKKKPPINLEFLIFAFRQFWWVGQVMTNQKYVMHAFKSFDGRKIQYLIKFK